MSTDAYARVFLGWKVTIRKETAMGTRYDAETGKPYQTSIGQLRSYFIGNKKIGEFVLTNGNKRINDTLSPLLESEYPEEVTSKKKLLCIDNIQCAKDQTAIGIVLSDVSSGLVGFTISKFLVSPMPRSMVQFSKAFNLPKPELLLICEVG